MKRALSRRCVLSLPPLDRRGLAEPDERLFAL